MLTLRELGASLRSGELRVPLPTRSTPVIASPNDARASAEVTPIGVSLSLRGWVRSLRVSKATSFLLLSDGTTLTSLQCILDAQMLAALPDKGASLTSGCSVEVRGQLVLTWKARAAMQKALDVEGGPAPADPFDSFADLLAATAATPLPQLPLVELQVSSFTVLGLCDTAVYPMHTKQAMSLEHLRDWQHLRTRTSTLAAVMRVRSRAQLAVHQFFHSEGFFHVHTPVLTPLDCEGAGEVFTVTTTHDKPNEPVSGG